MTAPTTLYAALVHALRNASDHNTADVVAPAAVLWTDGPREWESLLTRLRAELPIITLGRYDPPARTGPAIWLRCIIAHTLPEAALASDSIPIIYLPGISRQQLRAVDECPPDLQPLAELQFRGTLWSGTNNRDWTISGFLRDALQVEVAADGPTTDALFRSLEKLADEPLAALRRESPLTAVKLNALMNPEPVRNLLLWLNNPKGFRAQHTDSEWTAFRETCLHDYKFDADRDGNLSAALLLGTRDGIWDAVWSRFAEAPARYPEIPGLLRRARPANPDGLLHNPSSWPQDNEAEESALRERLAALKDVMPDDARRQILQLEQAHGVRRNWVWAESGHSPLATALSALVALGENSVTPLGGSSPNDVAEAYVSNGWKTDATALDALAVTGSTEDISAIKCAVDALYRLWLRDSAEVFQRAIANHPFPAPPPPSTAASPKPGLCWLFADGLRYDVGQQLANVLEFSGLVVDRGWRWAALPTVTATSKPSVSPAAPLLGPGLDLNCIVRSDGAKVTADILRRELSKAGYDILSKDETGDPESSGWTECGAIDSEGHSRGCRLAARLPDEVKEITGRVKSLLESGWREVRIITDHGWLWLPFGLPKVDLPEHLTEFRKGRCARLKTSATTDHQMVPWRWNQDVSIAVPPGIGCYVAGHEYDHGGLSPQECITPVLTVRSATPAGPPASISSIRWTGLRCRVQTNGTSTNMTVDLRTKPADVSSSLAASPKSVDAGGQASIVVMDDSHLERAAVVVLLGADGTVLAQRPTVVGEDV